MPLTLDQAQPLIDWANERHAIYMRKTWLEHRAEDPNTPARMSSRMKAAWGHEAAAWDLNWLTDDPVMRQFRFCNVYRELDRVTVWIREHIREPFADHEHLWYMLAAARYINWPDTLADLIGTDGWPDDEHFSPETMTVGLELRKSRGVKMEGGAYMLRAESDPNAPWYNWSKQRYISEVVLGKLWAERKHWRQLFDVPDLRLQDVWLRFQDKHYTGWGPFMAGQVVTDLRWTRYLRNAPDIQTWTALGPGSARGLNRLHGRDVKYPLKQDQGVAELIELRELVNANLASWMHPIDLSDIQNCCCETDKWLRVRNGEGRPRSMYVPGRGS
jgi:hypothetical protein